MKTKVIFRIFPKSKGGEVIALFPEEPGTNDPRTCLSYVRNGQHGAASVDLGRSLRLATPEEYAPLKRHLETYLGPDSYNLDVRTRSCPAYAKTRREAINL